MPRARSIRLVAVFDLLESLRSRKAVLLLALYLLGSLGGSAIFIRLVGAIQERLEDDLGQEVDMARLMASPGMARVIAAFTGDAEVARAVVAIPPMAIFYGWLAMTFVPLLTLFTSADAIAGDLQSGAVRFSLFRTDRVSWALGKLLGQTFLLALGILVGALGCWAMGMLWLDDMPAVATAYWLARMSGRAVVYCFAYLGMVLCASQLARTPIRAGGIALLIMFVCLIGGSLLQAAPIVARAPLVFEALSKIVPNGHHLELWHPAPWQRGAAMLGLVAIGLAWFGLGFWRFRARDA
jgi:hypothetical protein